MSLHLLTYSICMLGFGAFAIMLLWQISAPYHAEYDDRRTNEALVTVGLATLCFILAVYLRP